MPGVRNPKPINELTRQEFFATFTAFIVIGGFVLGAGVLKWHHEGFSIFTLIGVAMASVFLATAFSQFLREGRRRRLEKMKPVRIPDNASGPTMDPCVRNSNTKTKEDGAR